MEKLKDVMFCWNPKTDQVKVGPMPVETGWSRKYMMSAGGCWAHVQKMNHEQAKLYCYLEAMHMIIRDRVDPDAVHRAFCGIVEYHDGLSADMPGSLNHGRSVWE